MVLEVFEPSGGAGGGEWEGFFFVIRLAGDDGGIHVNRLPVAIFREQGKAAKSLATRSGDILVAA